jgi:hypothetical protein
MSPRPVIFISVAEVEYRAVHQLLEKVLRSENRMTLLARMGIANALDAQGKYAEAEYRAVLKNSAKSARSRASGHTHDERQFSEGA